MMRNILCILFFFWLGGISQASGEIVCTVDAQQKTHPVDFRIFGSNLEWFNDAGGLLTKSPARLARLQELAEQGGITVQRFPGGILADYYDWRMGTGPQKQRPLEQHPSDSGSSRHGFGSPEYFSFLKNTGAEGLITVNAGTGSAELAADWVRYANWPDDPRRRADGIEKPVGIKLWEIGNELYLPGNPEEKKITVTPKVYARRYLQFAKEMRAVDPSIELLALGVANSHVGPASVFRNWTETVLAKAADEIDYIAVHNAYFPLLFTERQPPVEKVYRALFAAPEAVDNSLGRLERLLAKYEGEREIGIAITEWGMLFSLPGVDNTWFDHVKTMGSGVYVGRLLQVFMEHPRVKIANYFKFVDRSFMGWIDFAGRPKVPYWVFRLYARHTGKMRVFSEVEGSPTFSTSGIDGVPATRDVEEVTALATLDEEGGRLFVNLINRSLHESRIVRLDVKGFARSGEKPARIYRVATDRITDHNGRDIPPEWPWSNEVEPQTDLPPGSVAIEEMAWDGKAISLAPFSVVTLEIPGTLDEWR